MRDAPVYHSPEDIEATARERAIAYGMTLADYQAYCARFLVVRHESPGDEPRCPKCGELWPCDNEVGFLRAISRGRELAKGHGW